MKAGFFSKAVLWMSFACGGFAGAVNSPLAGRWLPGFTVYSGGNLEYVCSHLEGPVGAGGEVRMNRMGVAGQAEARLPLVAAGSAFSLLDGSVDGNAEAGGWAWLHHYSIVRVQARDSAYCSVDGKYDDCASGVQPTVKHGEVRAEIRALTERLSRLASVTVQPVESKIRIEAGTGESAFRIDGKHLNEASSIAIQAPESGTVIILVNGTEFEWGTTSSQTVSLTGGIKSGSVLFAFLEASRVKIHDMIVKGNVFSPYADVSFYEGRINGSLILGGNLLGNPLGLSFTERISCKPGSGGGLVTRDS